MSIGLLGTKFSYILIEIQAFSFTVLYLKMSSVKSRPFFNVLIVHEYGSHADMVRFLWINTMFEIYVILYVPQAACETM